MLSLIRQPHHITTARYAFTLQEQRILLKLVSLLQGQIKYSKPLQEVLSELNGSQTFSIRVKELMRARNKKYKEVKHALRSLLRKEVVINGTDKDSGKYEYRANLLSSYRYFENNEFVEIEVSKTVLGLFLAMSSYTKYSFDIAFNSSSVYTSRLYQYISHWREKPDGFKINLLLDVLRDRFSLDEKYERPGAIMRFIIVPALQELREKADIWFTIEETIKEGRKVVGWKIKIHKRGAEPKETAQLQLIDIPAVPPLPPLQPIAPRQPTQKQLYRRFIETFKLSAWQATAILESVPQKEITQTLYEIQVVKSDARVRNIGGYTAKIFNKKYNLGF